MSKISVFNTIISNAQIETLNILDANIKSNAYEVLGVNPNSLPRDIKTAYHAKLLAFHTDKIGDKGKEPSQVIIAAYDLLSDSEEKKQYDISLAPKISKPKPRAPRPAAANAFVNVFYIPNASHERKMGLRKEAFELMIAAAQATQLVYSFLQGAYKPSTWWNRFFVTDYAYRQELTTLKKQADDFLNTLDTPLISFWEKNTAYLRFVQDFGTTFGQYAKKIKEKNLQDSDELYKAFFVPFGVMGSLSLSITTLINRPHIETSNTTACFVHQGKLSFYTEIMKKDLNDLGMEQYHHEMGAYRS